uniref:Uncharacterized protein n=1 Tax=Anopheles melas TaxID=34690 RepID=A0A182TWB2_9DIPT
MRNLTGAGTWTAELLRLAAARIRNQQRSVVLGQDVLQLLARRLIDVLLVEGDQRLGDGLPDGVDLCYVTAAAHADADVDAGELFLAEQQQRLLQLVAQDLRLDLVQRAAIDTQQSLSALAVCNGGGSFLRAMGKKDSSISTTQ